MANVIVTVKIMPISPDVDMAKLKTAVEAKISSFGGRVHSTKEEPIAFGLVALNCIILWNEAKDPDVIETELAKVKDVNSVQTTDVRRALG